MDKRKSQVYGAFDRLPLLPIFYYGVSSKMQTTTTTKQNAHTKIPRLVKHVRKLTAYLDSMRVPLTATTKLVGVQCRLWLALVGRVAPFPSTKIIERPGPVSTKKLLFDNSSHYSSSGPVFEKVAIGIVTNFGKPNNAFLYFRDLAVRLISLYRTRAFIGLHLSV